jgi:acyl-CoA synthetase (AMP-forming)/AMP-acid ligase II
MSNSPEMVMSILALQKLGAVAALLNTNLRGTRREDWEKLN